MNLIFNRLHTNGWMSYRIPGVPGQVFVDKRMLTPEAVEGVVANPPATIELDFPGFASPGADVTSKAAEKAAKKAELEQKKAERATAAAAKVQERLAKLQDQAAKAQAIVDKARAKASGVANVEEIPAQ